MLGKRENKPMRPDSPPHSLRLQYNQHALLIGLCTLKGIMGILRCHKDTICSRVICMIKQYSGNIWRVLETITYVCFVIGLCLHDRRCRVYLFPEKL